MKLIVNLLCLIACLPTLAATLEDRLAQIAAVDNVQVASIVLDADGKSPELRDMPGFPGWRIAKIAYLLVTDDAVEDNTVAVVIDPDGNALWSQREPAILAEAPVSVGNIGTESEIIAEIERTQSVKALKYSIDFDGKGADVLIVIEASGKAIERHYRVYQENDAFVVKPYEASAEAMEAVAK